VTKNSELQEALALVEKNDDKLCFIEVVMDKYKQPPLLKKMIDTYDLAKSTKKAS